MENTEKEIPEVEGQESKDIVLEKCIESEGEVKDGNDMIMDIGDEKKNNKERLNEIMNNSMDLEKGLESNSGPEQNDQDGKGNVVKLLNMGFVHTVFTFLSSGNQTWGFVIFICFTVTLAFIDTCMDWLLLYQTALYGFLNEGILLLFADLSSLLVFIPLLYFQ